VFTVIWRPSALNDLATAWVSSGDRRMVTEAAERVDRLLSQKPGDQGESRPLNRRIMFERPLVVTYEILEADRTVVILGVRSY